MSKLIFIPGNVPALKNSKEIVYIGKRCNVCRKGHRPLLISSKRVKEWKKDTAPYWRKYKAEFLAMISDMETPYRIRFRFIRKSRHKFDYTNALDTIQDEMVQAKWISDDNSDILRPIPLQYRYDKENPGVEISVKP